MTTKYYKILIFYLMTPEELKEKYQSSSSFASEMKKVNQHYALLSQQAHYSTHSNVDKLVIMHFEEENQSLVDKYFINGVYQEEGAKAIQRLTVYFISQIPRPKRPYLLVYFNQEEKLNGFTDFKNILSLMPIEYFINLTKILVVRPSFKIKANSFLLSFGCNITKFINSMTIKVDSLQQLSQQMQVKSSQIVKSLPYDVRQAFLEEEKQLQSKRNKVSSEIKKGIGKLADTKMVNSMPQAQKKKKKKNIKQYRKNQRGVPEMFELLIYALKQNKEGLFQEGIFRKSANIEEQEELLERMEAANYNYLETVNNPHLLASGIKKFLAKLESPLIPYEEFYRMMEIQNLKAEHIASEVKVISEKYFVNLLTLMVLVDFLKHDVLPKQNSNKMTIQNLGICFAPCLMWAKQRSIKDIAYATKSVKVVMLMLIQSQKIFGNHQEKKKIYRSSFLEQKKISLNQSIKLDIDEEEIQVEKIKKDKNRETPNFGELILKATQSQMKAFDQLSQSSCPEDNSETFTINEINVKKSNLTQSQRNKKIEEDQEANKVKQCEKEKQKEEEIEKEIKKEITGVFYLKPPQKRKRGIFSSHIQSGNSDCSKSSVSSNRSNKSIHSINSDIDLN